MDFVAMDLETTGINPDSDCIVEIGAVRFVGGVPQEGFSSLVNPEVDIPADASRVSGITNEMVRGQPLVKEVLGPFAAYCGDLPLVAHNAKFDFKFLFNAVKAHQAKAPGGTVIDSFSLAKTVVPGLPNYRLDTLIRHFRFEGGTYHRAEQDAVYCGRVFYRIVCALKDAGHPVGLDDLIALSGKKEMRFPQIAPKNEQLGLF